MNPVKSMPVVSWTQVRRFRLLRSGLIDPFETPEAAAHALAGIQAQIHPAAGLALQNRTPTGKQELTDARFDALLFDERTLVKLWGQRGTLHVYATRDWPMLTAARSENLTWWERNPPAIGNSAQQTQSMSAEVGDDAGQGDELLDTDSDAYQRASEAILTAMLTRESMGRSDVRALGLDLPEEYYSPWGGIFHNLVRTGWVCHARRLGNEGHFAHRQVWTPDLAWEPPTPEEANLQMARRFFAAYAPAVRSDFMYWRYLKPALMDRVMADLLPELTPVSVEGEEMFVLRDDLEILLDQPADADAMPIRMLYRFDPLLLGNRNRKWIIDPADEVRVSRIAGHIEGIVLDRGRIVATWRYVRKGKGLVITVEPFGKLRAPVQRKLPKLAERVARYFRAPLQEFSFGEDTTIYPGRGRARKAADV